MTGYIRSTFGQSFRSIWTRVTNRVLNTHNNTGSTDQTEGNNNKNIINRVHRTSTNEGGLTDDRPPRRIDTHHHIIPDFFIQTIKEVVGDHSGIPTPKWSVEKAKEHMSQLGVETTIVSIPELRPMIYENKKEKGRALARQLNEYSADFVKNNPKQFGFFASLPSLTDVEGTLKEIDYVHSTLAPDGYTLFTSYGDDNNQYLGYPSFQPIWAKLNQLKSVVFIHPSQPPTTVVNRYLSSPVIDFPQETTRTVADLVVTGTRAMFPDVKIILSHGGGTLPFLAHRISAAGSTPYLQCPRNSLQILEDLRSFYFDTALSTSAPQLEALLEFADPSKIVFGSDIPYAPPPTIREITKNLDNFFFKNKTDENLWQAINHDNAKHLFPNKVQD